MPHTRETVSCDAVDHGDAPYEDSKAVVSLRQATTRDKRARQRANRKRKGELHQADTTLAQDTQTFLNCIYAHDVSRDPSLKHEGGGHRVGAIRRSDTWQDHKRRNEAAMNLEFDNLEMMERFYYRKKEETDFFRRHAAAVRNVLHLVRGRPRSNAELTVMYGSVILRSMLRMTEAVLVHFEGQIDVARKAQQELNDLKVELESKARISELQMTMGCVSNLSPEWHRLEVQIKGLTSQPVVLHENELAGLHRKEQAYIEYCAALGHTWAVNEQYTRRPEAENR